MEPAYRDRHARNSETSRTGIIADRLRLMFECHKGMLDENASPFLYHYDPQNNVAIGDGELIRKK